MNGRPRDDFVTDIVHLGLPTFSPQADDLVKKILDLSGDAERKQLDSLVSRWRRTLEPDSFARLVQPPWSYLRDFAPDRVDDLEGDLRRLLDRRERAARERGWEIR